MIHIRIDSFYFLLIIPMTEETIETPVEETTQEQCESCECERVRTVEEMSDELRNRLKLLEDTWRAYIQDLKDAKADWEVIAQATLAMRHIEDARMRYGKVIQYLWDGVSIYDKK